MPFYNLPYKRKKITSGGLSMETNRKDVVFIGLALLLIGVLTLLQQFNIIPIYQHWWLPIILIILGILEIISRRGIVQVLAWLVLIIGVILLLITLNVISISGIMDYFSVLWVLLGLLLIF